MHWKRIGSLAVAGSALFVPWAFPQMPTLLHFVVWPVLAVGVIYTLVGWNRDRRERSEMTLEAPQIVISVGILIVTIGLFWQIYRQHTTISKLSSSSAEITSKSIRNNAAEVSRRKFPENLDPVKRQEIEKLNSRNKKSELSNNAINNGNITSSAEKKIDAFANLRNLESRLEVLDHLIIAERDYAKTLQEQFDGAPERLRGGDTTVTHPYTLIRAATETWHGALSDLEAFLAETFDEMVDLRYQPSVNRFLHLKSDKEPEGLDRKLQDEYRRFATIRDDLQEKVVEARQRLEAERREAESVLGIKSGAQ